jgi:hypothetical protein
MSRRAGYIPAVTDEIEYLRRKRGDQNVTFAQVADHLHDFVDRVPTDRDAIQRLGRFLADVEDIDHSHENDHTRGLR